MHVSLTTPKPLPLLSPCTTSGLVSHVWGQLVASVNRAEPITEAAVKDLIEDACESQVGAGVGYMRQQGKPRQENVSGLV
jgi:hypothetical protein